MAYADVYATANDAVFIGRAYIAIRAVARDVVAEAGSVTDHAHRLRLANAVLADTEMWAKVAALRLAEAGIATTATDVQLGSAIASGWNTVVSEVYWGGAVPA